MGSKSATAAPHTFRKLLFLSLLLLSIIVFSSPFSFLFYLIVERKEKGGCKRAHRSRLNLEAVSLPAFQLHCFHSRSCIPPLPFSIAGQFSIFSPDVSRWYFPFMFNLLVFDAGCLLFSDGRKWGVCPWREAGGINTGLRILCSNFDFVFIFYLFSFLIVDWLRDAPGCINLPIIVQRRMV